MKRVERRQFCSGCLRSVPAEPMAHTRGRPYHPMNQGKIERYYRSMKNLILLEHYYLPGHLEKRINAFVEYYNHRRYHESLNNLTPADVYYGRGQSILIMRTLASANIRRNKVAHSPGYAPISIIFGAKIPSR